MSEHTLKAGDGAARLDRIGMHATGAKDGLECGGAVGSEQARASDDVVCRHAGDLGNLLGRVVAHAFGKFVEPVGPLLYPIGIVELLFHEHVHEAERQGALRTGTGLKPVVGVLGQVGIANVDHNVFGLPRFDAIEDHLRLRTLSCGTRPPVNDRARVRHVAVAVAVDSQREGVRKHKRHEAYMRRSERPAFKPERGIEPAVPVVRRATRPLSCDDGLRTVFVFDAEAFFRDDVERFVP